MDPRQILKGDRAPLATLAAVAGGDKWSKEAIEAHMASELAKAPPPSRFYAMRGRFQSITMTVTAISFAGMATGLLTTLILAIFAPWLWALFGVGLIGLSVAALLINDQVTQIKIRAPAAWEINFYPYPATMPERARRIIEEMKRLQPGCEFRLHELKQGDVYLDPILEVCFTRDGKFEQCYPLVWDKDGSIVSPPA